ncbi:MAG TPA: DUF998 domain-containing protein [Anaerolineales bacterium]|jgi:hypothetical protein|nr:DUF998 domain-containing protein [Anaerolineales bacterium]
MIESHPSESQGKTSSQLKTISSQSSQLLSQLAILAIAGQVILFASAWLLPLVSEYSLMGDNISELVLGRYGFIQTAAFVISGLGTLGLAFAIRQLTKGTWGSFVGPLLVGMYGLGAILSAIFPTDRIDAATDVWAQSTTGMIHSLVALISFPGMVIGMFLLTRTFGLLPAWRSIMRASVFFPAGSLGLLVVQGEGPLVGLLQRLLVAVISGWIILVALRVRKIAGSTELEPAKEKRRKETV